MRLTVEHHETWFEDHRYLNMDLLKEKRQEAIRQAIGDAQAHQGDPRPAAPPPSLASAKLATPAAKRRPVGYLQASFGTSKIWREIRHRRT